MSEWAGQKWEYHVVRSRQTLDDDELNSWGRHGWELVSTTLVHDRYHDIIGTVNTFKRPIVVALSVDPGVGDG